MSENPAPTAGENPSETARASAPLDAAPAVNAENPPKRRPGRPRKHPLPDPNAPKRPRGRPRKEPGAPLAKYKTDPSRIATEPLRDDELPSDVQDRVRRDAAGQWVKGGSPAAGGLTRTQLRIKRMLEDATPAAMARLVDLIASSNEQVALGAVRTWLERVAPPPPKAPPVAVSVAVNSGDSHLAAMSRLAELALRRQAEDARALPAPAAASVSVGSGDAFAIARQRIAASGRDPGAATVIDAEVIEVN